MPVAIELPPNSFAYQLTAPEAEAVKVAVTPAQTVSFPVFGPFGLVTLTTFDLVRLSEPKAFV